MKRRGATSTTNLSRNDERRSWKFEEHEQKSLGFGLIQPNPGRPSIYRGCFGAQLQEMITECKDRDIHVGFTHRSCGTKLLRVISTKVFKRGFAVARCEGCHQLVVLADPQGILINFMVPTLKKMFDYRLKRSSLDSFCATFELEPYHGDEDTERKKQIGLKIWEQRDMQITDTHDSCGTPLRRVVSQEAFHKGIIIARCHVCNQLAVLSDPNCFFMDKGMDTEMKSFLDTQLKKGSLDAFCATFVDPNSKTTSLDETEPDSDAIIGGIFKFKECHGGINTRKQTNWTVEAKQRDMQIDYTHDSCRTALHRVLSQEAFKKGIVITRCHGCHKLVVLADPTCFFTDGITRKMKRFLDTRLKQGSLDTYCATFGEQLRKATSVVQEVDGKKKAVDETASMMGFDPSDEEPDSVVQERNEHNHTVWLTHSACKKKMVRSVSRQAYESGLVVTRCTNCNDYIAVADHFGWLGQGRPEIIKNFMAILSSAQGPASTVDLKEGSEDTFCATYESYNYV